MNTPMRKFAALLTLLFIAPVMAENYRLQTLADDLSNPWSVAFLPDGGYLIAERDGQVQHLRPDGERVSLAGVPDTYFAGQGGFFDIVLDPDFARNQVVYLSYAHGTPDNNGTGIFESCSFFKESTITCVISQYG